MGVPRDVSCLACLKYKILAVSFLFWGFFQGLNPSLGGGGVVAVNKNTFGGGGGLLK